MKWLENSGKKCMRRHVTKNYTSEQRFRFQEQNVPKVGSRGNCGAAIIIFVLDDCAISNWNRKQKKNLNNAWELLQLLLLITDLVYLAFRSAVWIDGWHFPRHLAAYWHWFIWHVTVIWSFIVPISRTKLSIFRLFFTSIS